VAAVAVVAAVAGMAAVAVVGAVAVVAAVAVVGAVAVVSSVAVVAAVALYVDCSLVEIIEWREGDGKPGLMTTAGSGLPHYSISLFRFALRTMPLESVRLMCGLLNNIRCTHWLGPRNFQPSPHIWAHIRGRYWSAKIDDISV
jgi:hypothetical protein